MSANAGSGGVRNLRAMFEHKPSDQSNSPPSRGRSPSGSVTSSSSRPVSKVRASFVAVERPGDLSQAPQWGLRKASDVSSMAEVREENSLQPVVSTNGMTEEEKPTSPASPHMAKQSIDGGLGAILKGSAFEGTPKRQTENPKMNGSLKKQEPKTNGVASRAAAMVEKMKSNDKPKPPPATALKTTPTAQPVKPPHPKHTPATQSPKSPSARSPKTPTSPAATRMNIRGGPAKIRGVMESAKRASEGRDATNKEETPKSPVTGKAQSSPVAVKTSPGKLPSAATASTAASQGHRVPSEPLQKPAPKPRSSLGTAKLPSAVSASTAASKAHTTDSQSKPATKPRSSAPPARLPSAATAKTAASAAKTDHGPAPTARKPSSRSSMSAHQSKAPTAATAGTASTLAKKSSRASLANGELPKSRVSTSAKPDDSFLARMARQTTSSAAKLHEKPESKNPPRGKPKSKATSRSVQAPRTSDQSHAASDNIAEEAEQKPEVAGGTMDQTAPDGEQNGLPPRETQALVQETPHTNGIIEGNA